MTRDETIKLAKNYCDYSSDSKGRESFEFDDYGLFHFAELIAAVAREECAQICDQLDVMSRDPMVCAGSAEECAAAIRDKSL